MNISISKETFIKASRFNDILLECINTGNWKLIEKTATTLLKKTYSGPLPKDSIVRINKVIERKLLRYEKKDLELCKTATLLLNWTRAVNKSHSDHQIKKLYITLMKNYYDADFNQLVRIKNSEFEVDYRGKKGYEFAVILEVDIIRSILDMYKVIFALRSIEINDESVLGNFFINREQDAIKFFLELFKEQLGKINQVQGIDGPLLTIYCNRLIQAREEGSIDGLFEFGNHIKNLNTPLSKIFIKDIERRILINWFEKKFKALLERIQRAGGMLREQFLKCPYYALTESNTIQAIDRLASLGDDSGEFCILSVKLDTMYEKLNSVLYNSTKGLVTVKDALSNRFTKHLKELELANDFQNQAQSIIDDLQNPVFETFMLESDYLEYRNSIRVDKVKISIWPWICKELVYMPPHFYDFIRDLKLYLNGFYDEYISDMEYRYAEKSQNIDKNKLESLKIEQKETISNKVQQGFYRNKTINNEYKPDSVIYYKDLVLNSELSTYYDSIMQVDLESEVSNDEDLDRLIDRLSIHKFYEYEIGDKLIKTELYWAHRVRQWFNPHFDPRSISGYETLPDLILEKQKMLHNFAVALDKVIIELGYQDSYYNEQKDSMDTCYFIPIKVVYYDGSEEQMLIAELTQGSNGVFYHRYLAEPKYYDIGSLGKRNSNFIREEQEKLELKYNLKFSAKTGDGSYICKNFSTMDKLVVKDPKNQCQYEVMVIDLIDNKPV